MASAPASAPGRRAPKQPKNVPLEPYPQVLEGGPDMLVISYPQVPDDSKQELADHQFFSSLLHVEPPWGIQQPADKAPGPASSADGARHK